MGAKKGVIILAHGSRRTEANEEVTVLVDAFRRQTAAADNNFGIIASAFLQFGKPSLRDAVLDIVNRGCEEVIILPLFLTTGVHITTDIPRIIAELEGKYPDVVFRQCRQMGCDEKLIPILMDRLAGHLQVINSQHQQL